MVDSLLVLAGPAYKAHIAINKIPDFGFKVVGYSPYSPEGSRFCSDAEVIEDV